jgi:anti-anti-sigma factor
VVLGELDVATAPELKTELASLEGTAPVVVDLCDTAFMDSCGLRALLSAEARHRGRFVVACAPTGPVQRVFDVAADGVLSVYPDRSSAVAAALA